MGNLTRNAVALGLLCGAATAPAGTNDLFEAKTATAAIHTTTDSALSNNSAAERKAKKRAAQGERKAMRAYSLCPANPADAADALNGALQKLSKFGGELASIDDPDAALAPLGDFF